MLDVAIEVVARAVETLKQALAGNFDGSEEAIRDGELLIDTYYESQE